MAKLNYTSRLSNLKGRRQDVEILKKAFDLDYTKRLNESYEYLSETDAIKYAVGAMLPVDNIYTQNTITEGNRVKNQLEKGLPSKHRVEFRYQGSVTNNTHIKAHSDIDLLTLHGAFYRLEHPLKPTSVYQGDPLQDLINLRSDCYVVLSEAFPAVDIDNKGAKCISLSGGSLRRKIDVVPSCWLNTPKYAETGIDYYRAVEILDLHDKKLIKNTPFLHNKLLEIRDASTKVFLASTKPSTPELNFPSTPIPLLGFHG
ncbi:MAG: hypothetical protein KA807_19875 [Prolixibacteraceae bacterium]|nr:hypothetical protein [Prolixibacteraceae bacterium]